MSFINNSGYELLEEYDDGELYSDGEKAVKFVWGFQQNGAGIHNSLDSFAICEVGVIEDGEFIASDDMSDKFGWWIPEESLDEEDFIPEEWDAMEDWQKEMLKEIYEDKPFKQSIILKELTGQESGIIIYDDNSVAVVNWNYGEGIPHWLVPLHDPIYMSSKEAVEDCGRVDDVLSEIPDDGEVIYDRNDDIKSLIDDHNSEKYTAGHVYQIGEHYRVIAPVGWN